MRAIILAAVLTIITQTSAYPQDTPLYRDAHAPIAARVQDLLGRMTLEEKIAQLQSTVSTTAFGRRSIPSSLQNGHINTEYAGQSLTNGLRTFVLPDDFLGVSGTASESRSIGIDPQMKKIVETGSVEVLIGDNAAKTEAVHRTLKSGSSHA